ncbi:MAG TPA: leucine--tRNA ligase [Candidatus Methylomirabilis sp.]|nr:leucine--tRNA ligase [Candidatus Methylomirabilis sp.]
MAGTRPFKHYEPKWQKAWEEEGVYRARDASPADKDQKFYGLIEFPYPSGDGLHVGHPRSYTAIDAVARKKRMEGKNVLYPIGWDAFGLPTENYAIKNRVKPQDATVKNIATFRRQLKSLGFGFDWSREVNTTDPAYYKWTQWMFLKFFTSTFDETTQRAVPVPVGAPRLSREAGRPEQAETTHLLMYGRPGGSPKQEETVPRLAYKARTTINWCPNCKIGLANEEAVGGLCERCGNPVEKRVKEQWMIRITKYADRLLSDLDTVDYLEKIKTQQVNWIGKSEGAHIDFRISTGDAVRVFTTRPDTLFGATYMVLAPEHELVQQWIHDDKVANAREVNAYREAATKKTEMERQAEGKEKTGVVLEGVMATNPTTGKDIPVWIADYVLAGYGTGAIMAVPAHDERDFEFANAFSLPIVEVVRPPQPVEGCYVGDGAAVNSGFLDGLPTADAKQKVTAWLEEKGLGERATTYRLRDWVFSRQRYWGEPIPIVICKTCGYVPVPEDQLPVLLPDVESYQPTDTGESPLSKIRSWVEVRCPNCGGDAERETDTMPNWAGSSWYFLRYCDPKNDSAFADPEKLKYWMPVDLYNGGMEHTTLHLLYSRFWHKFLWDIGAIPNEVGPEPYARRRSHGLVLAKGGEKMSKSKGNVVNPDEIVEQYGADVFRVYEMFMGPFGEPVPWDTNGIEGVRRFLDKVWKLFSGSSLPSVTPELDTLYHQTVKKVSDDIESLSFNTAVSQLMILTNAFVEVGGVPKEFQEGYLKILAPFAPHIAEELWRDHGHSSSIHVSPWPAHDASKIVASSFELVVQVNGKVRDRIRVPADISEEDAKARSLASENVKKHLGDKPPSKVIYVKGRLVTIAN